MRELVMKLLECVGADEGDVLWVSSVDKVESFLKKELHDEKYVCFQPMGTDPQEAVYQFWRMLKAGIFDKDCCVIFLGVKDCPCWDDLVKIYGGLRFGSLFLLKTNINVKPGVVPSQRGMYLL